MTNKEAKEKAIRKAWEDIQHWVYLSESNKSTALECDGFVFVSCLPASSDKTLFETRYEGMTVRPKQLSGLENNNGWTRIEPDGSNLPLLSDSSIDNRMLYRVCFVDESKTYLIYSYARSAKDVHLNFKDKDITHFKPIEVETPPIW